MLHGHESAIYLYISIYPFLSYMYVGFFNKLFHWLEMLHELKTAVYLYAHVYSYTLLLSYI
jgi:hypothetical protein